MRINEYLKHAGKVLLVPAGLSLSTILTTPGQANAQARQTAAEVAAQQRAQQRQSVGQAVPRTGQSAIERNIPSGILDGVVVRDSRFSTGFYLYRDNSGASFEGYVNVGRFYPYGFGPFAFDPFIYGVANPFCPRPMSRFESVAAEWDNVSRRTLPIGASIYTGPNNIYLNPVGSPVLQNVPRYDPWGQPIAEPIYNVENPVNERLEEENRELKERIRKYELDEARREGYEQARRELVQQLPAQQQPQRTTEVHRFGYAENGPICPEQFQSEGNKELNHVFDMMAARGERRLYAYTDSKNHKLYTAVVDLNTNKILVTEDYSGFRGRTGSEFVAYDDAFLEKLGINRKDYIPTIIFENHNGSCGGQK